jgi:hypothetical protein
MKNATLIAAIAVAVVAAGSVTASRAASAGVPTCPGHAPKTVSPVTARHFVRQGATAMRLCRYYGVNWGFPYGLRQQRLIHNGATISSITATFNGLAKPPKGIFCMKDDDAKMLVVFGYANAPAEHVLVKMTGCPFTTNGRASRWATPRLQHRLINLVKGS